MTKASKKILKKLSKRLLSLSSIMVMGLGSWIAFGEPTIPKHISEQSNK